MNEWVVGGGGIGDSVEQLKRTEPIPTGRLAKQTNTIEMKRNEGLEMF